MPVMRLTTLFIVWVVAVNCGGSRQQGSDNNRPAPAPDRPALLVAAAGSRPAEALARFVGADSITSPRVLVLSAGSDTASGPQAAADLRAAGAIATSIRLTRAMAESGQISALLNGTSAVWLTGLRADELGAALGGTATAVALERRGRSGMPVGGDGAGAGMLASVLIAGGDLPPVRRRGARQPEEDGIATAEGLGLVPGTLIYAPASSRRKDDALDSALAQHPRMVGIQLDSGAALIVTAQGIWESVGQADVVVRVTDETLAPDSTGAVPRRSRIVSPGSRFDPRTRSLLPLVPATQR